MDVLLSDTGCCPYFYEQVQNRQGMNTVAYAGRHRNYAHDSYLINLTSTRDTSVKSTLWDVKPLSLLNW